MKYQIDSHYQLPEEPDESEVLFHVVSFPQLPA